MYLGIDTGASKTLVGLFDSNDQLLKQHKFATPLALDDYLKNLVQTCKKLTSSQKIKAVGLALPGSFTADGAIAHLGNLDWKGMNLARELSQKLGCQVLQDNDANLAALAEAKMGSGQAYRVVLYVTISTGVGTGIVVNGQIDPLLAKSEGGQMIIMSRHKQYLRFEDLVSGPAVIERFGKAGYDIIDQPIWDAFAADLAVGLFNLIIVIEPEVVVIGGGMAVHFEAFAGQLNRYLKELSPGFYPLPALKKAAMPETAVLFGAYLLAKSA